MSITYNITHCKVDFHTNSPGGIYKAPPPSLPPPRDIQGAAAIVPSDPVTAKKAPPPVFIPSKASGERERQETPATAVIPQTLLDQLMLVYNESLETRRADETGGDTGS